MATSSTSSTSAPFGRGSLFRVATREISMDFSAIGPDQSPHDLGALSEPAFRSLIEKFAAIEAVRLLDGDPHLVVTARRGRFTVFSSQGQLLVRSAHDPLEAPVKFTPDALPAFLDTPEHPPATPPAPAKSFPSLIGSAALVAEAQAAESATPAAPIYGAFPTLPARTAAPAPAATTPGTAPRPARRRGPLLAVGLLGALGAAAALWFFLAPAQPDPASAAPRPAAFDRIAAPSLIASLLDRFAGTYATTGETGEKLLELRADGTFHFQEFGASLATTAKRNGTYLFAFRHGTKVPLIRASGLGTIELREDGTLLCQQAVFKKVP